MKWMESVWLAACAAALLSQGQVWLAVVGGVAALFATPMGTRLIDRAWGVGR
jgi:hypothetical protein